MAKAKVNNKKEVIKNENLKAITKTIKTVNVEVQEAANFVAADLVENGQQLKDNAVKAVEGIKLTDSVKKIKKSAEKVNAQIKDAATTISDNVVKRGKKMSAVATERAEEAIEKIDLKKGYSKAIDTAKNINAYSLETASEAVKMAKTNNEAWSKLLSKAIDGGLKLGNKQQEIVFDTLETMKQQLTENSARLMSVLTKKVK